MRTTTTPTLKRLALAAFLATALPVTHASTIVEHYEQRLLIDFENLAEGASPNTGTDQWSAWTGSGNVLGAAPHAPSVNTSNTALQVMSGRESGFSSLQANPFTAGDQVLYLSAWFYRDNSSTSGARILIDDTNNTGGTTPKIAGFGVMDIARARFGFYDASQGTAGAWIESDMTAVHSTWYELALVVHIDQTDISKSLGSLYVRNVTANQTDFTLLTFNEYQTTSFEMNWMTDERNLRDHFRYWRYTNFRSNAQFDNLSAGVVAIPEPSTVLLTIGGLLMLPLVKSRLAKK